MKPKSIKVGKLYYIANEYRKTLTDETEIENTDMTNEFYQELNNMVSNKEIIIININGKMRLGKSTVAMSIGQHIYELLKKHKFRNKTEQFGMKNIARDQGEHMLKMRNPKTMFTVIVTDEENQLENTGQNSTTYEAMNQTFSDVQAARYVHRVCCSPKDIVDPNSDIFLNIIGIDRKNKITHAKIYYKLFEGGTHITQLIGYVRIPVGHIIKTWTKIEPMFLKPTHTKKEKQLIRQTAEQDWYTMYMIKKHEKMDMMNKEGIFRPKMLEVAKVIRLTVEDLKPLTALQQLINKEIVKSVIKQKARQDKVPMSIIGEQLATDEAYGMLTSYKTLHKIQKTLKKTKDLEEIELLKTQQKSIAVLIHSQELEMKRLEIIQEQYKNHET